MKPRSDNRDDAFNELVALLQRNEGGEKHAADVEMDMRRLLLMARDTWLRDQLIQVQGVRRVTLIAKATSTVATQRICAGILGNIAHSEQGRLSASSCDRWHCISHRHLCPLSMLLSNTQSYGGRTDSDLMRTSGAALLAFSVQNQCQRHLDSIAGIPVLLRLLDVKQVDGAATDVAVYAAAVLWNMCKAPALLLKLETIYGILKDQLTRKLSNLLVTPLEPFELFLTPTGERGMPVLLDFDGENLTVLVTASISTQLTVVLSVTNYVGRVRSLADQFRPKTPPAAAISGSSRAQGGATQAATQTGKSIAHYDESGVLASRSCLVCSKLIRVSRKGSRRQARPSLLCSRDGCGQMYHLACSRWAVLSEETFASITAEHRRLDAQFYCDGCVLKTQLCYWDFLAAHSQHERLLTESLFKSVAITRVTLTPTVPKLPASDGKRSSSESTDTESTQRASTQPQSDETKESRIGVLGDTLDEEDTFPWPSVMLFDQASNLLGVGDKYFHIAASSRDPEMYIVTVRYVTTRAYSAMFQERAIPKKGSDFNNDLTASLLNKCEVSYARQGALDNPLAPGNAVFWPAPFTRDIRALEYTRRSLGDLENAFLYEFQGEQAHDKSYSIGSATTQMVPQPPSTSNSSAPSLTATGDFSLWMALSPRKGMCMKQLAAQIGHLKKFNEVPILHIKKTEKPRSSKGSRKVRKPHFSGKKLSKVAVDATS